MALSTLKVSGNGKRSSDRHVIQPATQALSTVVNSAAAVDRIQSGDRGKSLWDAIGGGVRWLGRGWGSVVGLGQTGYDASRFTSSGMTETRTASTSDFKKSGGLGSLFGAILGGGTGLSLGGIISGIGSYFTEKAEMDFKIKELDVQESLGNEKNAINRLIAEGNIAAEKKQTAIASTYMGHTNPIANVEGVTGIEPGLVVADTWAPQEVRKQSGGALGGSNQGLITNGQQRRVA